MSALANETPHDFGYADRHGIAPRRGSHLGGLLCLAAVVLGDAVAFYQLAAVAMQDAASYVIWMLVVALSAAATVSMHLAGTAARARKAGETQPGWLWFGLLVGSWAALGGGALWFRLAAVTNDAVAGAGGGLGAPVDTGAATHVPMAVLLLMLYLVGGFTAYGIGFRLHNPARSAYLRARAAHRRASWSYWWLHWINDRALRAPRRGLRLTRLGGLFRRKPKKPTLVPVPAPVPASSELTDEAEPELVPVADELAARRDLLREQALAQAGQLKELARHRMAAALGEPARTSGVFATSTSTSDDPAGND